MDGHFSSGDPLDLRRSALGALSPGHPSGAWPPVSPGMETVVALVAAVGTKSHQGEQIVLQRSAMRTVNRPLAACRANPCGPPARCQFLGFRHR